MQKLDKIKIKVAEQKTDPRSKTTADKAFNYIGTGKPEDASWRSRKEC